MGHVAKVDIGYNILILLNKICGKIGQLNNVYGKSGHKQA